MQIYLEIGKHGNVYIDWDSEFCSVDGVWLVKDGLDDLNITKYLSPAEIESAQQACISKMGEATEDDGYGDYLYDQRKDDILTGDYP